MKFILAATILLFISGCATNVSKSKLYWGDYSHTLYKTRTDPGEVANQRHLQELESIVSKSKELGLKVPPSIYAEMGMIHMSKNENSKAKELFAMEAEEYPESKEFIAILIAKQSK
jgi:hypothetical protein